MLAIIWGGRLVSCAQVRRSQTQNNHFFCAIALVVVQPKEAASEMTYVCQEDHHTSVTLLLYHHRLARCEELTLWAVNLRGRKLLSDLPR